jgi:hypothetical protein
MPKKPNRNKQCLRKKLLSDKESWPLVTGCRAPETMNEALLDLFVARKSPQFKSLFRATQDNRVTNYVNLIAIDDYGVSESEKMSPHLCSRKSFPQSKAISKKILLNQKRRMDISDVDSSSDFSNCSEENQTKKEEVQKNNKLFVSFYFDAN